MQLLLHLANDAGQIEVHSFLLKRRERTLAARSVVLEMLEVKEDRRFGRLDDDSAKVKLYHLDAPTTHLYTIWTLLLHVGHGAQEVCGGL